MIYETKGLALEEVDELYGLVSQAWKSKSFRPQVRFGSVNEMDGEKRRMSMSELAAESERRRSATQMEGAGGGM